MTGKANATQVGGKHYKTKYEHWDWVLHHKLDYLAGCATKYVARHRKKNGLEDLCKAQHYLRKLIEAEANLEIFHQRPATPISSTLTFAEINGLNQSELNLFLVLGHWETKQDLERALHILNGLIDAHSSKVVPLTEENHHAPRVGEPYED